MSTESQPVNPLSNYFRQPAIHIKLPSGGKYYPENALDLPVTGEIPVFPMTVKDELTLKTPDSLMNGSGIVEVINSCCPNILDPWQIPNIDLEAIFIAIKIASYGAGLDLSTECPHCSHKQEQTIDLNLLLAKIPDEEYGNPLKVKTLTFNFRPPNYYNVNDAAKISFQQNKLISQLADVEIDEEERKRLFMENFSVLTDLNLESIVNTIESIITPDGTRVTEKAFIKEFLNNADRKTYSKVKDHINHLLDHHKLKPIDLSCEECTKEYKTEIVFDQANFFA